jgi:hypothetical protein
MGTAATAIIPFLALSPAQVAVVEQLMLGCRATPTATMAVLVAAVHINLRRGRVRRIPIAQAAAAILQALRRLKAIMAALAKGPCLTLALVAVAARRL